VILSDKFFALEKADMRGTRYRCLLLTHVPRQLAADTLTRLAWPPALVSSYDVWIPGGFLRPDEARLGETRGLLPHARRQATTTWWLEWPQGGNTPSWDIASTCMVGDKPGLLLIGAQSLASELITGGKPAGHEANDRSIQAGIAQACEGLNEVSPGWNLAADSRYQLCSRFAWAWKLATLGLPVFLTYLGFLNVEEMAGQGKPFRSHEEWEACVLDHSRGFVPEGIWNQTLTIDGTPLRASIRSLDLGWTCFS
jgi:hypothetical protein